MQVSVDNAFDQGFANTTQAINDSRRTRIQQQVAQSQIAEAAARTQGLNISNSSAQANLDDATRQRGVAADIRKQYEQDPVTDPSMPNPDQAPTDTAPSTGLAPPSSAPTGAAAAGLPSPGATAPVTPPAAGGAPAAPALPAGRKPYSPVDQARDMVRMAAAGHDPVQISAAQTSLQHAQANQEIADTQLALAKDPSLMQSYIERLSAAHPELGVSLVKDPRSGAFVMSMPDPNKPGATRTTPMSPTAISNMVAGETYLRHGLVTEGLAALGSADTGLQAHAAAVINAFHSTADSSQGSARIANERQYQQGMVGVAQQNANTELLRTRNAETDAQRAAELGGLERGAPVTGKDAQGNPIAGTQYAGLDDSGHATQKFAPNAPGTVRNNMVDPKDVISNAYLFLNKTDPENPGRTVDWGRALDLSRQSLSGQPSNQGGIQVSADAVAKAMAAHGIGGAGGPAAGADKSPVAVDGEAAGFGKGMRPRQTPIYNPAPDSGSNRRTSAAASAIPAVQAEFSQAQATLQQAQAQGNPVAVAAARTAWSNARLKLQAAMQAAGQGDDQTSQNDQ